MSRPELVIPEGWTPVKDVVRLDKTRIVQFLNPDGTASAPCELPAGTEIEHPRLAVLFWDR